jgi:hypothetical protein
MRDFQFELFVPIGTLMIQATLRIPHERGAEGIYRV